MEHWKHCGRQLHLQALCSFLLNALHPCHRGNLRSATRKVFADLNKRKHLYRPDMLRRTARRITANKHLSFKASCLMGEESAVMQGCVVQLLFRWPGEAAIIDSSHPLKRISESACVGICSFALWPREGLSRRLSVKSPDMTSRASSGIAVSGHCEACYGDECGSLQTCSNNERPLRRTLRFQASSHRLRSCGPLGSRRRCRRSMEELRKPLPLKACKLQDAAGPNPLLQTLTCTIKRTCVAQHRSVADLGKNLCGRNLINHGHHTHIALKARDGKDTQRPCTTCQNYVCALPSMLLQVKSVRLRLPECPQSPSVERRMVLSHIEPLRKPDTTNHPPLV